MDIIWIFCKKIKLTFRGNNWNGARLVYFSVISTTFEAWNNHTFRVKNKTIHTFRSSYESSKLFSSTKRPYILEICIFFITAINLIYLSLKLNLWITNRGSY